MAMRPQNILRRGALIHRGLLLLSSAPPGMLDDFDGAYPYGYGLLREDVPFPIASSHLIGMQASRCALLLVERLYNERWSDGGMHQALSAIITAFHHRHTAVMHPAFRSIDPMDRAAYRFGMAALVQASSVMTMANAGLLACLPNALAGVMISYSCAAACRLRAPSIKDVAKQSIHSATESVRFWCSMWGAPTASAANGYVRDDGGMNRS